MTVRRAFPVWSERDFFRPNGGQTANGHGAGRGTNGGFLPMRTRQVGGMAFVIPLAEGECGEGLSGGLARIALEETAQTPMAVAKPIIFLHIFFA